mmetsp:Transcript_38378/g.114952  ORF Transcript_38378/g.114952 Transcript_38378/m.114952 type:complete len:83 (-) Transcript_38378:194-442(-)
MPPAVSKRGRKARRNPSLEPLEREHHFCSECSKDGYGLSTIISLQTQQLVTSQSMPPKSEKYMKCQSMQAYNHGRLPKTEGC